METWAMRKLIGWPKEQQQSSPHPLPKYSAAPWTSAFMEVCNAHPTRHGLGTSFPPTPIKTSPMYPGSLSTKTCLGYVGILPVYAHPDSPTQRDSGSMSHPHTRAHGAQLCTIKVCTVCSHAPTQHSPCCTPGCRPGARINGSAKSGVHKPPPRDRYLLGKLVIPISLHEFLKEHIGARAAKRSIHTFQTHILHLLPPLLPSFSSAQKASFRKRPNPWSMEDWLPPPH